MNLGFSKEDLNPCEAEILFELERRKKVISFFYILSSLYSDQVIFSSLKYLTKNQYLKRVDGVFILTKKGKTYCAGKDNL